MGEMSKEMKLKYFVGLTVCIDNALFEDYTQSPTYEIDLKE